MFVWVKRCNPVLLDGLIYQIMIENSIVMCVFPSLKALQNCVHGLICLHLPFPVGFRVPYIVTDGNQVVVRDINKSQAQGTWCPGWGVHHITCASIQWFLKLCQERRWLGIRLQAETIWKPFYLPFWWACHLAVYTVCLHASVAVILGQEPSSWVKLGKWSSGQASIPAFTLIWRIGSSCFKPVLETQ